MTRLIVETTWVARGLIAVLIALALHFELDQPVSAQQAWLPPPDRHERYGENRVSLDIGVLGASLGYSRQMSRSAEWGVAVSGGAQTGFMLCSSELTGKQALPLFVELLGGAAFIRGELGSHTELEGGVRVGWLYHSTEYETIFSGIYTALQYRLGAMWIGPRLHWGRIAEESGRSEFGFGVVPLLVGFRWSW